LANEQLLQFADQSGPHSETMEKGLAKVFEWRPWRVGIYGSIGVKIVASSCRIGNPFSIGWSEHTSSVLAVGCGNVVCGEPWVLLVGRNAEEIPMNDDCRLLALWYVRISRRSRRGCGKGRTSRKCRGGKEFRWSMQHSRDFQEEKMAELATFWKKKEPRSAAGRRLLQGGRVDVDPAAKRRKRREKQIDNQEQV